MSRTEQKHGWHLDDAEDALVRVIDLLTTHSAGVAAARAAMAEIEAARGSLRAARLRPKNERRREVATAMDQLHKAAGLLVEHDAQIHQAHTIVSVIRIVLGGLNSTFPASEAPRASEPNSASQAATTKRPVARARKRSEAPQAQAPAGRAVRSAKRTLPMGRVDSGPEDA